MKKTNSQNIWLKRKKKDIFIKLSKAKGYRSRAAYKLLEINQKFKIINNNSKVVDLGASPGGWTQVVAELQNNKNEIIAIDKKPMDQIVNCKFINDDIGNFLKTNESLQTNYFDVILSDMAANSTGHRKSDHLRIIALCEAAAQFSFEQLRPGGNFVAKVLAGGAEMNLQTVLKTKFKKVVNFKPKSSRSDSSEKYVVALGFQEIK